MFSLFFSFLLKEIIHQLMAIRQQQGDIWKELLLLDIRIQSKLLPLNLYYLEYFIQATNCSSTNNNQEAIQVNQNRSKIIHEAKLTWFATQVSASVVKIQAYDQQYQHVLEQLKSQVMNSVITTTTTNNGSSLVRKIEDYLTIQTIKLMQDIYKQVAYLRMKLLEDCQRSLLEKNMLSVSSEPYLDRIFNRFIKYQWNSRSYSKI